MSTHPFKINVPNEVIDDLRRRLANTRWPDEIPDTAWDYGSNLAYVKELVEYWRDGFDWRKQEAMLNGFNHFRAEVDGPGIHFIHERGAGPNPVPLVITHGWPSSIFEMHKIIPMLTNPAKYGGDPADSFDVVVPSIPGYGWSDAPQKRGMGPQGVGDVWAKLMTENLGYSRFAAHGGDWGASVTAWLGFAYPENVIGIHATAASAMPYLGPGSKELTEKEKSFMKAREKWQQDEGGYGHIQGTKPQTLAYGLNDSPTGLAAWIVEKFRTWSDCNGDVESVYTKDELLANITIYWVTRTISSSVRIYYERTRNPFVLKQGERIEVPSAIALFPKDIGYPPREWAERAYNVQRFTEMPRGGHFAALEQPELLVNDLREFFRPLRTAT
jgi:pimeloyl-ACP methyl ester carboxylesterase